MRIISIIWSLCLCVGSVSAQGESALELLQMEHSIFHANGNEAHMQIFNKSRKQYQLQHYDDALITLARVKTPNDSSLELQINKLKAYIYFQKRDFVSAYNYLEDLKKANRTDSTLYKILLIENLRLQEIFHSSYFAIDSHTTILLSQAKDKFDKALSVDCEEYPKKSKFIPGRGLMIQKKYKQGFINVGLIAGFATYGVLHAVYGYYATAALTGINFAHQFYKSGSRLSYITCINTQKKARDEFRASLYRLLLPDPRK